MTINERVSDERLSVILSEYTKPAHTRFNCMDTEVAAMARELQQYRAAAGSRALFTCSACGAEGLDKPLESKCHCCIDGAHWIESRLYAAPQVTSAPVVPQLIHSQGGSTVYADYYAIGWNACRAAMLQGAEPVQSWIPCSERMPEQFKAVLVFNEYGEVWSGAYDRQWNFYCDNELVECVTHWMPLPASPQQEAE